MSALTSVGQLSRWRGEAQRILRSRAQLESLSDDDFFHLARQLRWEIRAQGPRRELLPRAYALGIEAARRSLGMVHFPVQVMGAIALFEGNVAEMQTGEGKTLTATLPALFRAMAGRGAHVVTANDYLASRDAELMRPLYSLLGLSVGCVQQTMEDEQRRDAYARDITYGTASEMGFDFLRDRLKRGAGRADHAQRAIFAKKKTDAAPVQRELYFALVDEADCILIDEARTPLIIGVMEASKDAMVSLYGWCAGAIGHLEPGRDYLFDSFHRHADLTEHGVLRVNLLNKPPELDGIDVETIYQHVEKALTSALAYERDRDYVVHGGEIVIVDEGTGRKMDGRKWQAGLHQSVEAKEGLAITEVTSSAARVTVQSLFRHYQHLCGMTGTASQARRELQRVYRLRVCVIPTNRRCLRRGLPTRVFVNTETKHAAIIAEIQRLQELERSVLIGTPSVDASEALGARLHEAGIPHTILNARFPEVEAEIIAEAGLPGRVTVATNMAGRGTDILLDDQVRARGGLHVIATERHSSRRIDRQLVGRAARQGDPGGYQFFLSLEDELLRALPADKRIRLIRAARPNARGELSAGWIRTFDRLQRSLETTHTRQRRQLLKHEQEQEKRYRRIGLDPYLEIADE